MRFEAVFLLLAAFFTEFLVRLVPTISLAAVMMVLFVAWVTFMIRSQLLRRLPLPVVLLCPHPRGVRCMMLADASLAIFFRRDFVREVLIVITAIMTTLFL